MFDLDLRTSVMRWSSGMFHLLGFEEGTVVPSIDALRSRVRAGDVLTREQLRKRIATGAPFDKQCVIVGTDGSETTVQLRCEFVFDIDGHVCKMVCVCWQVLLDEL